MAKVWEGESIGRRFRTDPVTHLVAILSLVIGILFGILQGGKLLSSGSGNLITVPIGRFDLGFAVADILIPGTLLIIGAVCLLIGSYRPGHLLVFAGWTVNLYGVIVFLAGYAAMGNPLSGQGLVEAVVTIVLSLFCMVWSGKRLLGKQAL